MVTTRLYAHRIIVGVRNKGRMLVHGSQGTQCLNVCLPTHTWASSREIPKHSWVRSLVPKLKKEAVLASEPAWGGAASVRGGRVTPTRGIERHFGAAGRGHCQLLLA